MRSNRDVAKQIVDIGRRLESFRKTLGITATELSQKLGMKVSSYYKNESGATLVRLASLNRLRRDYNLSVDWLYFGKGEMYLGRREAVESAVAEKPSRNGATSEVRELLDHMEKDVLLKHEVMAFFYKYKEGRVKGGEISGGGGKVKKKVEVKTKK